MSLTEIMLFFPAAIIVAASPGANNLLAFSNASQQGFVPAVIGLSGALMVTSAGVLALTKRSCYAGIAITQSADVSIAHIPHGAFLSVVDNNVADNTAVKMVKATITDACAAPTTMGSAWNSKIIQR